MTPSPLSTNDRQKIVKATKKAVKKALRAHLANTRPTNLPAKESTTVRSATQETHPAPVPALPTPTDLVTAALARPGVHPVAAAYWRNHQAGKPMSTSLSDYTRPTG